MRDKIKEILVRNIDESHRGYEKTIDEILLLFPKNAKQNSDFTFTVNDGYCTYSYPLNIGSKNSIDDVVKKIYKAFKLKIEDGTFIK